MELAVIIWAVIILLAVGIHNLLKDKCPECKGSMTEESYDPFLGKAVYKCTKCGKTFVVL